LKYSWKASTTNNSTNDVDPTNAPKTQKPELEVKKPRKMIYNGLTIKETKLHTSLAALKDLMLITLPTIIKTQEPHLMQDLLYVHHPPKKGKHK
jgi:hypothetical protein